MKKYVFFILSIGIILGGILFYNIFTMQKNNTSTFYDSGYILKSEITSSNSSEIERYYFNANESYKTKYGEKIVFKDTEGQEVITDKYNFIHYSDGSISALENGVILNLAEIESDPITYYNIQAGKILKKAGTNYTISHLNKELRFTNAIWKIASNKYLIIGSSIKLDFQDETTRTINGYVEIEYMDNQIIKIYNQEVTFQTIASNVSIEMPDGVEINLDTKIVSKDGTNLMSLENMVINSDDNVDIVDLEEYEENENTIAGENEITNTTENSIEPDNNNLNATIDQENTGVQHSEEIINNKETINNQETIHNSETINNNGNSQAQSNTIAGGQDTTNSVGNSINNNTTGDNTNENNNGDESIYEEKVTINEPNFKVESFEIDSIKMTAEISIEDEDDLLTTDTSIKILKNSTGKVVYMTEEALGTYTINLEVAALEPDTEYTLAVESSYEVEDTTYTKNFIYKVFRTEAVGIEVTKDYITSNSMSFNVTIDTDSKVKSADVSLINSAGEMIGTQTVEGLENKVAFYGLTSNTEYQVKITNVLYDGQVIANGFEDTYTYTTLKTKPTLSGPVFTIDKINSVFNLSIQNVEDIDYGIVSIRYEIYGAPNLSETDEQEPVLVLEATNANEQVTAYVNGTTLQRNTPYIYKVVAEFEDNEKIVEYESEYSEVMQMDGNVYPTVTFEASEVTFERIRGNIKINDVGGIIADKGYDFTITYTNSIGVTKSFKSSGSLTIPVDINDLRANETYQFYIYATIDLQDGNGEIDEGYIGGVVVKTESPNNLQAEFVEETDKINSFNVAFQLYNQYEEDDGGNKNFLYTRTLEAETLTSLTFELYSGDSTSGAPITTKTITDENAEAYESTLKETYYDNSVNITPSFFGLSNTQIRGGNSYTLKVTNAYDYTTYKNNLPIINDIYLIKAKESLPDLPIDINDAITVVPIKNSDLAQSDINLESDTIVGYKVQSKFDNSEKIAQEITYNVYMVNPNGEDIQVDTKTVKVDDSGTMPMVTFDVGYGTEDSVSDTSGGMKRGNTYYFTYTIKLVINDEEILYPYEEEDIICKSKDVEPAKQLSTILLYPTTSTENSITYAYQIKDLDYSMETVEEETTSFDLYINNRMVDRKIVKLNQSEFQEVTFENLTAGTLKILTYEKLYKESPTTETKVTEHIFEGIVSINNVTYTIDNKDNQLIVSLQNIDSVSNRIGMFDVIFKDAKGEILLEKPYQTEENGKITISLIELSELLGKTVYVDVYAYYDNGQIGFDTDSSYVTYQRANDNYYYSLKSNNLSEAEGLEKNIYEISEVTESTNTRRVRIQQLASEEEGSIEFTYSSSGARYRDTLVLQKSIERTLLSSNLKTATIDVISPGISMQKEIETTLDTAVIQANIQEIPNQTMDDNKIYIDLYETDDRGVIDTATLVTIEKTIEDFQEAITIPDLQIKTNYAVKFRVNINGQSYYLYDTDENELGKAYLFSTLADVNIDNITVNYNPTSYDDKQIDITYTLGRTSGFDKIRYEVYEYDETKQNYLGEKIATQTVEYPILETEMKYSIQTKPGVYGGTEADTEGILVDGKIFEFNKEYILSITAIKTINEEENELDNKTAEFILPDLIRPNIAITANRTQNTETGEDQIRFGITIIDNYKVIKDDTYKIKIINSNGDDITPEEYKDPQEVDTINRTVILNNVNLNQNYTIQVITQNDLKNDGGETEYIKEYTVQAVGSVSVGNISAVPSADRSKIVLVFQDSYKLTDLTTMKYTIYTQEGNSVSKTIDLQDKFILNQDEAYAYYTLEIEEQTEASKNYFIELQFYQNEDLMQQYDLQYVYTE